MYISTFVIFAHYLLARLVAAMLHQYHDFPRHTSQINSIRPWVVPKSNWVYFFPSYFHRCPL